MPKLVTAGEGGVESGNAKLDQKTTFRVSQGPFKSRRGSRVSVRRVERKLERKPELGGLGWSAWSGRVGWSHGTSANAWSSQRLSGMRKPWTAWVG